MKDFDTRVYNISDFLEWRDNHQLDLSPDFQRRAVWSEKAKSYLVDTIVRGKPMPKILITQELRDRRNVRVVVDGQQRLRAILGFIDGDFKISRAHNRDFANFTYDRLPKEIREDFLKYEIGVDLLYDIPYADLLDIFARINTYTVKLNSQERLNAKYLGYFKQNAYALGYRYVSYLLESGVVSKSQVTRMAEAQLASDLLVSICDGVQTNKSIEAFYKKYEDESAEMDRWAAEFDQTMAYIGELYPPAELATTNWARPHIFYSLFTAIAHGLFGLQNIDPTLRPTISERTIGRLRTRLDEISARYDEFTSKEEGLIVPEGYRRFIEYSRRGTTDTAARVYRCEFICEKLIRNGN